MKRILLGITALMAGLTAGAELKKDSINYIDEVVWVVGDEPILRSDIEVARMQAEQEGVKWSGDPDCRIPEQIAVQKLFLNQAALDSIEVTEAEISQGVDQQINAWIQMIGSQEKLEEYRKQSISQIRASLHDEFKNRELTNRMRRKLVEDVKVTPADVRRYFNDVPQDSLPVIPTTVEVQIITLEPRVPIEEINKVKDELRDYTERVQSGQTSFATLARLYSEDPGSARQGGEMDYIGRGMLDPAFAQVAFNLTDPKKISKIVESEFGFHIIQLIDKRGDKIKCRHILRKPTVPQSAIEKTMARMDSIVTELRQNKFPFEEGATYISDDKDTRNNRGLMSNVSEDGRTSRFEMKDLPTEIARVVDTLQVGQVSDPFTMINSRGKTTCVIAKLKNRTDSHRAKITEDFQVMSNIVLEKERQKVLREWVQKKIKDTYVRMDEKYKGCDFEYDGWVR
jgi:peptidyl-prolyl cis-trans isomerase SurA